MSATARRLLLLACAVAGAGALLAGPLPRARAGDPPKPAGGNGAAPAGADSKKVSLPSVLKGSVVSFDGTQAEVHYDLADPAQLEDFPDYRPFHLQGDWKREWIDKTLHLTGTGGVVWKPILRNKAEMEFEVRLKVPRDFGAFLAEDRISDELAVFSIYDQYFQNKDHRGQAKTHMICRMTVHAPDAHGDYAFRYVSRSPNPPVGTQKAVRVRLAREGADEWMEIEGSKINGSDATYPALRGLRPGFYVTDSEAFVSSITIRGDLDPAWMEKAGVDPSILVKPKGSGRTPEREPTDADFAARQRIDAVRTGAEKPGALIPILENTALLDAVREEAAKVMEDSGELKVVKRLVSTLESQDLASRKLGLQVVAKLTGRSWGFSPDGPEDSRRKAVRSLLDYIEKNPAKFQ